MRHRYRISDVTFEVASIHDEKAHKTIHQIFFGEDQVIPTAMTYQTILENGWPEWLVEKIRNTPGSRFSNPRNSFIYIFELGIVEITKTCSHYHAINQFVNDLPPNVLEFMTSFRIQR